MINEKSYDYVKNQLLYLGFGEEIAKPLRDKMEQGLVEFELPHSRKFGKDDTSSILHFSKGDDKDKDMTFFNRVDVTLRQVGKEDLTQSFFIGKEYNYTLQERYRTILTAEPATANSRKWKRWRKNGVAKMVPTGEIGISAKGVRTPANRQVRELAEDDVLGT